MNKRSATDPSASRPGGVFYGDAVRDYARMVSEQVDKAADLRLPDAPLDVRDGLTSGIDVLHHDATTQPGWSDPVRLTGHARVLHTSDSTGNRARTILATPLYVEYASSIRPGPGKASRVFRRSRQ